LVLSVLDWPAAGSATWLRWFRIFRKAFESKLLLIDEASTIRLEFISESYFNNCNGRNTTFGLDQSKNDCRDSDPAILA
jgi:hypothetical protein